MHVPRSLRELVMTSKRVWSVKYAGEGAHATASLGRHLKILLIAPK